MPTRRQAIRRQKSTRPGASVIVASELGSPGSLATCGQTDLRGLGLCSVYVLVRARWRVGNLQKVTVLRGGSYDVLHITSDIDTHPSVGTTDLGAATIMFWALGLLNLSASVGF